jgi:MFS family permease
MKLNYKKTFLIGFGFLATMVAWAVYNAYVPIILQSYIKSTLVIGAIMTIDNVFGMIFQPLFGHLSDRSKSKMGKRMPYIMVGIPVCAVLLAVIPLADTILATMLIVIAFNFVMSVWRTPAVALMPDITPSPLRSKANGVVNVMGGAGTLLIFVFGGVLFNHAGMKMPFIFAAIIMLVSLVILRMTLKNPPLPVTETMEERDEEASVKLKQLPKDERKKILQNLFLILLAILFWFIAYSAIETFFTLYATNSLVHENGTPVSAGDASIMLGAFTLVYLIFAIPAGILGTKFWRKRVIMTGLIGMVVTMILMYFSVSVSAIWALLLIAGVFWSSVAINSYPMVVDMGTEKDIGLYTGFYYTASFLASVISPVLFGVIRDITQSYQVIFLYSAIAFFVALILMLFVKRGEAKTTGKSKDARSPGL